MKRPNRNASLKSLLLFTVTTVFGAAVWAGGEPWKGKPYQQWDDKDIERVFLSSPWSRVTTVTRTWLPVSSKDLPDKIISGAGRQVPTELERSSETSVGGELNFYVFWASSRVMRAASARKAILHGEKKDLDLGKYAREPQDELQILVQSEDMAPFTRKDENFFQANAFLQPKKSKQRISPSHIRYERDAKGILVTSALFFFPRKTPSGDPTIAADEKNVEFNCNMDGSTLRVNFEPQKMVDQVGPDL
jgi:hypothetical protein